jgi:hypothetical protein
MMLVGFAGLGLAGYRRANAAPERRRRIRRDHNTVALSRENRRFRDGLGWFSTGTSQPRN